MARRITDMINDETRRKIEQDLGATDDEYFKECYRMVSNGDDYIVIYPADDPNHQLTQVFHEDTGEFVGLQSWAYAKEYGELL